MKRLALSFLAAISLFASTAVATTAPVALSDAEMNAVQGGMDISIKCSGDMEVIIEPDSITVICYGDMEVEIYP